MLISLTKTMTKIFVNDLFPVTKTRLRRDENGSLKIKTMTKSILTLVDETRRDENVGG